MPAYETEKSLVNKILIGFLFFSGVFVLLFGALTFLARKGVILKNTSKTDIVQDQKGDSGNNSSAAQKEVQAQKLSEEEVDSIISEPDGDNVPKEGTPNQVEPLSPEELNLILNPVGGSEK